MGTIRYGNKYTFGDPKVRAHANKLIAAKDIHPGQKKVLHINTGIEYKSLTEAGKVLGLRARDIGQVCAAKRTHLKGNLFKFVE